MNLSVTIVGIGCGFDYSTLGPTHHGTEDISIMRVLPGLTIYSPSDCIVAYKMAGFTVPLAGPKYIRLDRTGFPLIYKRKKINLLDGLKEIKIGKNLLIISTGRMVSRALEVAFELEKKSISAGVIDIYRIKPLNKNLLKEKMTKYSYIATIEEHFLAGGLGSCFLEFLNDERIEKPLFRIGIENKFCRFYGKREYLQEKNKLDAKTITKRLIQRFRLKDKKG